MKKLCKYCGKKIAIDYTPVDVEILQEFGICKECYKEISSGK